MADGIIKGLEKAREAMTNSTVDQIHSIQKEIGPRQFGMEKKPERDQAVQGALIWNDANAWAGLLRAEGWQGPGTPIPKSVMDYGQRIGRLAQKYPDEFAKGQTAKEGLDSLQQQEEQQAAITGAPADVSQSGSTMAAQPDVAMTTPAQDPNAVPNG